jgi:hypothetical protein
MRKTKIDLNNNNGKTKIYHDQISNKDLYENGADVAHKCDQCQRILTPYENEDIIPFLRSGKLLFVHITCVPKAGDASPFKENPSRRKTNPFEINTSGSKARFNGKE